jgi:hypothetical protein
MQINLYSKAIKNGILYLGWILFFLCLWCKGCSSETSQREFTKAVKKTFKSVVPKQKEILHFANKKQLTNFVKSNPNNPYISELEDKIFDIQKQNDSLKNNFKSLPDTIKTIEYDKAIQLKLFEHPFEDDFIKAQINGIVQGDVKDLGFSYERKKQPIPITKFRLLLGGGIGANKELNQGIWKFNAGFQNKKGNIIRASYMGVGNQKYVLAEYDFSIFKIVR